MALSINQVHQGDCTDLFRQVKKGSIDLVFADPPFNIGYQYDVYDDKQGAGEYLSWCRQWMSGISDCLKPNGTFWLAIGDEYAAELKVIAQETGFVCRSWVIWYYTFGVNCTRGFSRSHTHLFHFVADAKDFTFNAVNPKVRVPSARQLVYGDSRANPKGRLPDNTWIMRPQDAPESFRPDHDVWFVPRVAGTFGERQGFHGCQMPEQLLGRIIRASSCPNNVVLDPFSGSGTTLSVAKKLGRRWLGFELSREYVASINKRLTAIDVGDPLTGPEDPLKSSPATAKGRRLKSKSSNDETEKSVVKAFKEASGGHSVDHLLCDPKMIALFVKIVRKSGTDGNEVLWNKMLLRLRKSKKLPRATKQSKRVTFQEMDDYSFASEIAMRLLSIDFGLSIENVLCCGDHASEFDRIASEFAPGFTPFEYRWAALAIRKRAGVACRMGSVKFAEWIRKRLPRKITLEKCMASKYDVPGVYLLSGANQRLYVGESESISQRVQAVRENENWQELEPVSVTIIPGKSNENHALQTVLIGRLNPLLNSRLLHPEKTASAV